jgi:hypothetical protein
VEAEPEPPDAAVVVAALVVVVAAVVEDEPTVVSTRTLQMRIPLPAEAKKILPLWLVVTVLSAAEEPADIVPRTLLLPSVTLRVLVSEPPDLMIAVILWLVPLTGVKATDLWFTLPPPWVLSAWVKLVELTVTAFDTMLMGALAVALNSKPSTVLLAVRFVVLLRLESLRFQVLVCADAGIV